MPFNCPEFFLLTEEDFLPSEEVLTRDQMTEEQYQEALRKDGCYDVGDDGKSFYDES